MNSIEQPLLPVRSTADMIAAVPYLLGFHPSESVVVVALRGRRVVFAARGDLPAPGQPAAQRAAAASITAVVGRQGAEAATVIGYGPAELVTPAVDAVRDALARAGLRLLDALRVTGGRYWSYLCDNPECCPAAGTPFDAASTTVAAAATFAGQVALPDRAALVHQIAPVEGSSRESMGQATARAEDRLARLLDGAPSRDLLGGRTQRRAGESAVSEAFDRHRLGAGLTDDEVAWLSLLLTHLPVRDHAWERTGIEEWHRALWTDVVRRAEDGLVAAPATLLAGAAWRAGQGALAVAALERALDDRPDYSLALLLEEALRNGIQPSILDSLSTAADGPYGGGPAERRGSGPDPRTGRGPGRPRSGGAVTGGPPNRDRRAPGRRRPHRGGPGD